MLQKLYCNSDITTTINYQQSFITKDNDDSLVLVIGDGELILYFDIQFLFFTII